jgi:hypothetical protein
MNEMEQLSRFRDSVPLGVTPRAEQMFRTALDNETSAGQHVASRSPAGIRGRGLARLRGRGLARLRGARSRWRYVLAISVAAALAVGLFAAVQPSGTQPMTVQLLADRAAAAAATQPDLSAGQWIYQVKEWKTPGPRRAGRPNPSVQSGWMTADGRITYGGAGIIGNPIFPYNKIDSLPRDPAKLLSYFRSLDPVKTDNNSIVEFSQIESMLFGMVVPSWLEAEMFHALALIPMIQVKDQVTDISGRAGVAFLLPPTKQSEQEEIILDASDYHLLAHATWDNPATTAPDVETALLQEYPVAQLGSTQQAIAPPSAAELAAEKIDYYQEYQYYTPKISSVTPSQWLYRELSTGGKEQQIWSTADDSAQAEYVNGTLTVCQRTAPCAASETWLMPAGPSFTLIYPQYPRLTPAEIKQLRKLPAKQRLAKLAKLEKAFRSAKPPPTLPAYPQPLLAKLNTYATGCTNVTGDCNVVNVAANVLTGYGNYPSLVAIWFYALADVAGAGLQHITDAAGNQDIEFTFPAQDGVTGILVNATLLNKGDVQYEGFIRNGQQTLVLNQTPVSGPGVHPAS